MESYTWTHQCWSTNKTYINQLCVNTGCRLEDLPKTIADRDESWERIQKYVLLAGFGDEEHDETNSLSENWSCLGIWKQEFSYNYEKIKNNLFSKIKLTLAQSYVNWLISCFVLQRINPFQVI